MKYVNRIICLLCFPLVFMNTQCDEDDLTENNCGQVTVIDNGFFKSSTTDNFSLASFDLNEDCLTVQVSASGCDGDTWSLILVDSGNVAESFPPQRFLKLIFSNEEECLAAITQSRIFNLANLRVEGTNEVVLNIEGIPEPLNYMYP